MAYKGDGPGNLEVRADGAWGRKFEIRNFPVRAGSKKIKRCYDSNTSNCTKTMGGKLIKERSPRSEMMMVRYPPAIREPSRV